MKERKININVVKRVAIVLAIMIVTVFILVKAGDFEGEYLEGIYLDCNKEGSAKKPQTDYRLFRFRDGKVRLLDLVIDAQKNWAQDFWDAVEDEL